MNPVYRILAGNTDITQIIQERFISLTIKDSRGHQSDSLEINISDTDTNLKVKLPRKGVKLDAYLGYKGEKLYHKGQFVVSEITHSGAPDKITIHAKAADMLESLKVQKTRSWHQKTLGTILEAIASEHGLIPAISAKQKAIAIEHIDQTEESDMHFITRLAKQYDAVAKPVTGRLLFTAKGDAKTVSGNAMPLFTINRKEGDTHHYSEKGLQEYTGTRAYWQNKKNATRTGEYVGDRTKVATVKGTFPSKAEAKAAAESEFKRLSRDARTLEIDLKHGKPELIAESRIQPTGYRPYIDIEWISSEVTHSLDSRSGLQTQLQMEQPNV